MGEEEGKWECPIPSVCVYSCIFSLSINFPTCINLLQIYGLATSNSKYLEK